MVVGVGLGEQWLDYVSVNIGESIVASLEFEGQAFVIDSEAM